MVQIANAMAGSWLTDSNVSSIAGGNGNQFAAVIFRAPGTVVLSSLGADPQRVGVGQSFQAGQLAVPLKP